MRGVWLAYGQGPTTPLAWQASNHASGVAGVQRGSITLQPFGRLRARVCRGLVSSNFKEKVFPCGSLRSARMGGQRHPALKAFIFTLLLSIRLFNHAKGVTHNDCP